MSNFEGRVVSVEHASRVLENNPLGDPAERVFDVWLPPGYDAAGATGRRRFPVLFDLAGYTSSGRAHTAWRAFGENLPERAERLVAEKKMPPCIIVFPDCFTKLGGNQYINSSAVGRYADYLTQELIPFIDREFRTKAQRKHRAVFGKSSGGYGALIHGMKYSRYWGAIASHAGDCYFDLVYRPDWPAALDVLAQYRSPARKPGRLDVLKAANRTGSGSDDGRIKRFLQKFWSTQSPSSAEVMCLMALAMAATYDPDPEAPGGFRIPFDLETGELIATRWRKWLRHDPIHLVKRYAHRLRELSAIYLDCGWRDQYRMHYGNRILSAALQQCDVPHRYEEFDGTHSGIDHRLDVSLPLLARAIR